MAAKAIWVAIIAKRRLHDQDRALVRSVNKRVDMARRFQRTNGPVEAKKAEGGVVWRVI